MDSIEAHRVKNVPGNLQALRQPEEGTANQCPTIKESTGAPVSASEQDSHTELAAAVVQGLPRPNLSANIAPGGTQHCGGGKRTCVLYRVTVGVRKATSTVFCWRRELHISPQREPVEGEPTIR